MISFVLKGAIETGKNGKNNCDAEWLGHLWVCIHERSPKDGTVVKQSQHYTRQGSRSDPTDILLLLESMSLSGLPFYQHTNLFGNYPCLQNSATGWRSCNASDTVGWAELGLLEDPPPPPASHTLQHPETLAALSFKSSCRHMRKLECTWKCCSCFTSEMEPFYSVWVWGCVENSHYSESLCSGRPSNAAQWFQHCPAAGWAQLLERATSAPSLSSQGWTSCNIKINSSLSCFLSVSFTQHEALCELGWRQYHWLVRSPQANTRWPKHPRMYQSRVKLAGPSGNSWLWSCTLSSSASTRMDMEPEWAE